MEPLLKSISTSRWRYRPPATHESNDPPGDPMADSVVNPVLYVEADGAMILTDESYKENNRTAEAVEKRRISALLKALSRAVAVATG